MRISIEPYYSRPEAGRRPSQHQIYVMREKNKYADRLALDELQRFADAQIPPSRGNYFSSRFSKKLRFCVVSHDQPRQDYKHPFRCVSRFLCNFTSSSTFSDRLNACIRKINQPGFTVKNQETIEHALQQLVKKQPSSVDAHLWLGIIQRISGKDAEPELSWVLQQEPSNRLAILNLAALPMTFSDPLAWGPRRHLREKKRSIAFLRIERFLASHPHDCFARLIYTSLLKTQKQGEGYAESLELLYLDWRNYTPSIALLARDLCLSGHLESALDFATEARNKCPVNLLAVRTATDVENLLNHEYGTISSGLENQAEVGQAEKSPEMIFQAPYALQDPCWQSK